MSEALQRLQEVRARIEDAERVSGRPPGEVRLIAVSKQQSLDAVRELADAGQFDFGENQVQDALGKISVLGDDRLSWHFIGHLQTNKTRFMAGNFDWVHSIDSEKLVRRIAQEAGAGGGTIQLLIQVNVTRDPAKHGVLEEDLFPFIDRVLQQDYPGIRLRGLMTIGRRDLDVSQARHAFAGLRGLLEQCRERFGAAFTELSMGMSGDYALAVEEGATMVRVGAALFGPRPQG